MIKTIYFISKELTLSGFDKNSWTPAARSSSAEVERPAKNNTYSPIRPPTRPTYGLPYY